MRISAQQAQSPEELSCVPTSEISWIRTFCPAHCERSASIGSHSCCVTVFSAMTVFAPEASTTTSLYRIPSPRSLPSALPTTARKAAG